MLNDEMKIVENDIRMIEKKVKDTLESISIIKENLDAQFSKLEKLHSDHWFYLVTMKRNYGKEIRELKKLIEDKKYGN